MPFFLLSLAIWRVSSLFAREEGPFDLFLRFRVFLGVEFDENSEEIGTNWISKGILCVWCSSIWLSALSAPLISGSIVEYLENLLALSAMAIIIDKFVNE